MHIFNYPLKKIKYSGDKSKISMPLGGIGTGCIGLSKSGRLNSFKIFGKPSEGGFGEAIFAVKAECGGKVLDVRELKAACEYDKGNNSFDGIFPVFSESDSLSSYPVGETDFLHKRFPGKIHLTAWNPLIPFGDIDSGIPAAFLEYEIENTSQAATEYTFYGMLRSPFGESRNIFCETRNQKIKCVKLENSQALSEYENGEMCIGVFGDDIKYQEYLSGADGSETGRALLENIKSGELSCESSKNDKSGENACVISSKIKLKPGEKEKVRFAISWYMPYCCELQSEHEDRSFSSQNKNEPCGSNYRKNYYTRYFASSDECIYYCLSQWDRLYEETGIFREQLFTSTLPIEILDAVSSNISVLKTPTCQRYSDGTFLGFDGCSYDSVIGDAVSSKTWNYAYALSYLFPSLERALLTDHFEYDMNTSGALSAKSNFPNEIGNADVFTDAEAQFGDVLKVYRAFRLCGNTDWLLSVWKRVIKAVEYAQSAKNPNKWDIVGNGVIVGSDDAVCNPGESAFYLSALAAVSELSKILKDKKHTEKFHALYQNGKSILNDMLISFDFDTENDSNTLRQILTAQWHCNVSGIGEVIYSEIIRIMLRKIYDGYASDFQKYSEIYSGMEYMLSYLMINNGMTNEALELVRRTRALCDGSEKNPFGENSTGMNSTLSLSSYTLLGAICNMQLDNYNKYFKFCPDMRFAEKNVFTSVVCFENFIGFAERGIDYIQLKCLKGSTLVRKIEVPDIPLKVKCGGIEIGFEKDGNCAILDNDCEVNTEHDMLVIFRI